SSFCAGRGLNRCRLMGGSARPSAPRGRSGGGADRRAAPYLSKRRLQRTHTGSIQTHRRHTAHWKMALGLSAATAREFDPETWRLTWTLQDAERFAVVERRRVLRRGAGPREAGARRAPRRRAGLAFARFRIPHGGRR